MEDSLKCLYFDKAMVDAIDEYRNDGVTIQTLCSCLFLCKHNDSVYYVLFPADIFLLSSVYKQLNRYRPAIERFNIAPKVSVLTESELCIKYRKMRQK